MTAPLRAIGYVRVSKAREEMISPELQTTAITEYCERSRASLIDIVEDLDTTGRNFARAGIQRVIERVEHGEANLVIVWKWSRFGRNVRDCLINIDRLEVAGGRLIAATEDFDDTPVGRFGRGQFLLMAQFESERIGEQWREAQARRLRNGLPYNGRQRYGYVYDKATGYTIDPATSIIVREMFTRYLDGETPRMIAEDLNDRGVPAPQGGEWWSTTVQQVMETGFAAGLLRYNTRTGPLRRVNDPSFAEGVHEPIIDRATWDRYVRKRGVIARRPAHVRNPSHPFAGLTTCGSCHGSMYRAGGEDRIMCSAHRQHRECPRPAYTRLATVERAVIDWLTSIASDIDAATKTSEAARGGRSDARQQARTLTREITRAETMLVRLTRQYAEGIIPTDAYIATRDQITRERDTAKQMLDDITEDLEALRAGPGKTAPNLLNEWHDLDDLGKRDILAALIRDISITPQGRGRRPIIQITPRWERTTHT